MKIESFGIINLRGVSLHKAKLVLYSPCISVQGNLKRKLLVITHYSPYKHLIQKPISKVNLFIAYLLCSLTISKTCQSKSIIKVFAEL